jgi:hypothetical protein
VAQCYDLGNIFTEKSSKMTVFYSKTGFFITKIDHKLGFSRKTLTFFHPKSPKNSDYYMLVSLNTLMSIHTYISSIDADERISFTESCNIAYIHMYITVQFSLHIM